MACCPCLGLKNTSFCIGVFYSVWAIAVMSVAMDNDKYIFEVYGGGVMNKGVIIVSCLTLLSSVCLTYGVMEGNPRLVSPWLVMQLVCSLYTVVFYVWGAVVFIEKDAAHSVLSQVAAVAAVHIFLMLFTFIIINKYHYELSLNKAVAYDKAATSLYTP